MYCNITDMPSLLAACASIIRHGQSLLSKSFGRGADAKPAIQMLSDDGADVGMLLGYYTDDFVIGSYLVRYGKFIEERANELCNDQELTKDELCEKAKQVQRYVYADLIRKVFAGPESSSNPVTAIVSKYQLDAARKILEWICGLDGYTLSSGDTITDIFNGIERRKEEREAAARQVVRSVHYYKNGGEYRAIALNAEGEVLSQHNSIIPNDVRKKGEALTYIAIFTKAQRESGNQLSIIVEEKK